MITILDILYAVEIFSSGGGDARKGLDFADDGMHIAQGQIFWKCSRR